MAENEQPAVPAKAPVRNIVEHIITVQSGDRFKEALANKPVSFPAWKVAVLAEFRREPKLYEAAQQAPDTVIECLAAAASAGLMIGRAFDQFYLIPRWNSKASRNECTFIVGYKGMIDLAMRHRRVHSVEAFLIYRGEPFRWSPSTGELEHQVDLGVPRGDNDIVAAYTVVRLTTPDGMHVEQRPLYWLMTIDEIRSIRDRSQAYQQAKKTAEKYGRAPIGPWFSDFGKMARKTVIRGHYSGGSIPRALELVELMARETEEELAGGPVEVEAAGGRRRTTARAADVFAAALGQAPEPAAVEIAPKEPAWRRVPLDLTEEALQFVKENATLSDLRGMLADSGFLAKWQGNDRETVEQGILDRIDELESN